MTSVGPYLHQIIAQILPIRISAWVSSLAVSPALLNFKLPKTQAAPSPQSLLFQKTIPSAPSKNSSKNNKGAK